MCKWFKEMDCYLLTGEETRSKHRLTPFDKRAKLELSFRSYAAVFDNVKLVIKKQQAKEEFLNFPHVCEKGEKNQSVVSIAEAVEDAKSEALFIGSTDIYDFPLSLLARLLKSYNGETFLGYASPSDTNSSQPLFGIYNKKFAKNILKKNDEDITIEDFLTGDIKLIPLPDDIDSACIGL